MIKVEKSWHSEGDPQAWDICEAGNKGTLILCTNEFIALLDMHSMEEKGRLRDPAQMVCPLPGEYFAVAYRDGCVGIDRIDDPKQIYEIRDHIDEEFGVYGLCYNGKDRLACIAKETASIWDVSDPKQPEKVNDFKTNREVSYARFASEDNVILALDSGDIACTDIKTGQDVWKSSLGDGTQILDLDISGDRIIAAGREGIFAILSAVDGKIIRKIDADTWDINCVRMLSDKLMVSVSDSPKLGIWDIETGECLNQSTLHDRLLVMRMQNLSNGKLVFAGMRKQINDRGDVTLEATLVMLASLDLNYEGPLMPHGIN